MKGGAVRNVQRVRVRVLPGNWRGVIGRASMSLDIAAIVVA
jgi:hypothetical protein